MNTPSEEIKIQGSIWFVFRMQDQESIIDSVWQMQFSSQQRSKAIEKYENLECSCKVIINWTVCDGIKLFRAHFDENVNIDWDHVNWRALPEGSDIAWDVTIAIHDFCKHKFLYDGENGGEKNS